MIDNLPPDDALSAARDQVPARWRLEQIKPDAAQAPAGRVDVDNLLRAYLNADFLRCQTELKRPELDVDRMLEQGRRTDAARVATIAAACALGAGDEARAREQVRRLLVRELDDPEIFKRTTPPFQRLADDERKTARGRVAVEVRTEPPGASVQVDGTMRCLVAPCRLHVVRGEHVVKTEKLGRRARAITVMLDEDQTLTVALDQASADETRRQLSAAVAAGADPSGVEMARASATAFGVGLLVLTWQKSGQVHASVYQRTGGRLTHVAMDASGPDAAGRAVGASLREWKTEAGPRSMLKQPLFWTVAIGAAAASAAAVYFLFRPLPTRNEIEFR